MRLTIIAAMSENRVIGRNGALPWRLPADLRRFRARTTSHHVIMGRRTFESIGSRPLPERETIVISRSLASATGVRVVRDLDAAVAATAGDDEVFVAGGAEIYALALPRADRLDLTIVHAEVEGDTYFPPLVLEAWTLVEDVRHEADEKHAHAFSFRTYERAPATRRVPRGS